MAKGCDCGKFIRHEWWCASRSQPEAAPARRPGKKGGGTGLIPLEPYKDARERSQKGRAMQNVGKPLKGQPHQWDIPQGHECVKRQDGKYIIQEAKQKPWEDDAEFERRQKARHGQNI